MNSVQQYRLTAADIVERCHDLELVFLHEVGNDSGRLPQKSRLDLGISLGRGLEVCSCLVHRRLNVRIERTDLPGNALRLYRGLHRSAIAVKATIQAKGVPGQI